MKLPMWPRSTFTVPAICWPRTSTVSLLSSPPPSSSPPKFLVAVVVNYFLAGERAKTNAHNSKTRNPSFPPLPSPHLPRPTCLANVFPVALKQPLTRLSRCSSTTNLSVEPRPRSQISTQSGTTSSPFQFMNCLQAMTMMAPLSSLKSSM